MKVIDRYLLREISLPFFTSLFAMTFVLLSGKTLQLMDLVVNKGVSMADIFRLISFLIPYFLVFTIPISLLISILIGMGRLAGDNEITVLKGAGLSLYRISYPIALASCVAFLTTFLLSTYFVPYGNYAMKNLLFAVVRQNASAVIKEKTFNDNFKGILLYADKIPADGSFMESVMVSDNRLGKGPSTIFAEKAYLLSSPDSARVSLRLEKGSIHTMEIKRGHYRKMDFGLYDVNLDMKGAVAGINKSREKDSKEMTPRELLERIRTPGLKEALKREFTVELHKKYTLPLTCLIFCLMGIPIGVNVRKSVKARGLTISIIIVLLYYVTQLFGSAITQTGKVSPWAGMWFPTIVFTITGIFLFVRAAREDKMEISGNIIFLTNLVKRILRQP